MCRHLDQKRMHDTVASLESTNKVEKGKKDTRLNSWVLTEKNLFTIRNALSNKKVKPLFITKVLHIIRNNVHIATSVIIPSAEHTGESLVTGHCSEAECLLSPAAIHSFPCVNSVKYCNCKKAKSAKFGGGGWSGLKQSQLYKTTDVIVTKALTHYNKSLAAHKAKAKLDFDLPETKSAPNSKNTSRRSLHRESIRHCWTFSAARGNIFSFHLRVMPALVFQICRWQLEHLAPEHHSWCLTFRAVTSTTQRVQRGPSGPADREPSAAAPGQVTLAGTGPGDGTNNTRTPGMPDMGRDTLWPEGKIAFQKPEAQVQQANRRVESV